MFLKTDKKHLEKDSITRLYILEMWIDDRTTPVYKVGKASGSSSKKRMLSIAESYFDKYRELPRVKIVMDREVDDVFTKETEVHRVLKEFSYKSKKKFSGCTELFDLAKEQVVEVYEQVTGEKKKKNEKLKKCKRCGEEKMRVEFSGKDRICRSCKCG